MAIITWLRCFYFCLNIVKATFRKIFWAEVNLQHSAIWMAGVYLTLLMQFLENKVAMELTRSEFVEAQEVSACLKTYLCVFLISRWLHVMSIVKSIYVHLAGIGTDEKLVYALPNNFTDMWEHHRNAQGAVCSCCWLLSWSSFPLHWSCKGKYFLNFSICHISLAKN